MPVFECLQVLLHVNIRGRIDFCFYMNHWFLAFVALSPSASIVQLSKLEQAVSFPQHMLELQLM